MASIDRPKWAVSTLKEGVVIPAHPLALTPRRKLDERRQRALTRYYLASGAGGIAVGVHTTQFEIRKPQHGILAPVLELAAEIIREHEGCTRKNIIRIAGICGKTRQAVAEAGLASRLGYDCGLLSLAALAEDSDNKLLDHCRAVAQEIPVMGFYLQPAVGGRVLSISFWRRFVNLTNVVGIKIAPFNRYQTLDVIRAVAEAGRGDSLALYTGNDDHILLDLLTEYAVPVGSKVCRLAMTGGLLGHWACWTSKAVEVFKKCKRRRGLKRIPAGMLTLAEQVTDCNAAFFDAANHFAGCIPGIHEVLRRQGLLENTLCLNANEGLSPGQRNEIERVHRAYPHLHDDAFVAENLHLWLN